MGKDCEENGRELIKLLSQNLPGGTEDNHEKLWTKVGTQPKFKYTTVGALFIPEDGSNTFLETLNKLKGRRNWKFKLQNVP